MNTLVMIDNIHIYRCEICATCYAYWESFCKFCRLLQTMEDDALINKEDILY